MQVSTISGLTSLFEIPKRLHERISMAFLTSEAVARHVGSAVSCMEKCQCRVRSSLGFAVHDFNFSLPSARQVLGARAKLKWRVVSADTLLTACVLLDKKKRALH